MITHSDAGHQTGRQKEKRKRVAGHIGGDSHKSARQSPAHHSTKTEKALRAEGKRKSHAHPSTKGGNFRGHTHTHHQLA
jgi:hypothetical protein